MKIIDVLEAINAVGGCDATDEWSKGYDDGVEAAYSAVATAFDKEEEVEEQKYIVIDSEGNIMLANFRREIVPLSLNIEVVRNISGLNGLEPYCLTKRQIASYDKRYLAFAQDADDYL